MKTFFDGHHDLADWIRKQFRARCARIQLLQHVKGLDRVIGDWLLTPKVDPDTLTDAILAVAMREAEKLPPTSLYGAFAYRSGRSMHTDRKLWRIALGEAHANEKTPAAGGAGSRRARRGELAAEPSRKKPKPRAPVTAKRAATLRRKKPAAPRRT